jgi:inner membrane protein
VDNVCHTLVGAAIGESGLKRRTRYSQATLMIASNLPDLDVLVFLTETSGLSFRRGWTHGIAAQLLLPIALTGVVWTLGRYRHRRGGADGRPVHAGWLLLLSYIGVYTHVFLDYLNNYGIRLLAPLDWRWAYGDAVFIVDPWLWLTLGGGIWAARRLKRTQMARAAVVLAAFYMGAMLVSARAARGIVADVWHEARGIEPRNLMVGPIPVTPFTRTVIVDAGDRYEVGTFRWWPEAAVSFETEALPKSDTDPLVGAAREQSLAIREFLVWARFPFWTLEAAEGGTRVTVGDVRFMTRAARFTASTIVSHGDRGGTGDGGGGGTGDGGGGDTGDGGGGGNGVHNGGTK